MNGNDQSKDAIRQDVSKNQNNHKATERTIILNNVASRYAPTRTVNENGISRHDNHNSRDSSETIIARLHIPAARTTRSTRSTPFPIPRRTTPYAARGPMSS